MHSSLGLFDVTSSVQISNAFMFNKILFAIIMLHAATTWKPYNYLLQHLAAYVIISLSLS